MIDVAPPQAAALAIEGLSKSYPGVRALHNSSMAFESGEIVGLVGKNGAGKSTLIKALAGIVRPDSGTIRVGGKQVVIGSPAEASRLGLAIVHQELSLAPALTVAENVFLGEGFPRFGPFVSRRTLNARAREILREIAPDIDVRALVGSLSPVQQRLVMLAHGLAHNANVLVLDEPSAALTETDIERLHGVLRGLAAAGIAVVYVSHRLDEILGLTSRVIVMRDGEVVGAYPTAELDRTKLVELITGEPVSTRSDAEHYARRPREGGLEVRHLECSPRLRDISFTAHRGQLLGIAGLTASGRSTLMRCLFGTQKLSSGSLWLDGRQLTVGSTFRMLRQGIALAPEDRRRQGAVLRDPIYRNITLAALPRFRVTARLPIPSERKQRITAEESVERLSIKTGSIATQVGQLSGGNQQKVVLAKWLTRGAEVFLFDEPTIGVDVGAKSGFFELVSRLADQGKVCIVVSSEFVDLVEHCDRVVVIRDGVVACEFESPITEAELVAACYGD